MKLENFSFLGLLLDKFLYWYMFSYKAFLRNLIIEASPISNTDRLLSFKLYVSFFNVLELL